MRQAAATGVGVGPVGSLPTTDERAALKEEGCRRLVGALREMGVAVGSARYGRGADIYRGGAEGGTLHILSEGAVRLSAGCTGHAVGKEVTLRLIGPWEVFGQSVFAGERFRGASAEAVTGCEVLKVTRASLERAVSRRPGLALEVVTLLELTLVEYEELVGCLLPRKTETRLAKLLPILARKFGETTGDGRPRVGLRLTRSDLAAMVGSTRESVTAAINGLRRSGILAMEKGLIVVSDPERLAEIGRR